MMEVVVIADGTGSGAPVLPSPFWFIPIDGGGDPGDFGGSGGLYPCYACEPFDPDPGSCVKGDGHPDDVAILNSDNIQAEIATLWENSNPDAPNKDCLEQGAWVVETGSPGNPECDLVPFEETSNVQYTSCSVRGVSKGDAPTSTVAAVHTHPVTPGAPVYDLACLEAQDVSNPPPGVYEYRNPPNPSDTDYKFTINSPLHGYVVGPDGIWAYDGAPPDTPTPDHRLNQYERDDCRY